jgi:omega-amidase
VETLLRANPPAAGSLVVFPEMFATGFSMNVPGIRESAERETEQFLARLARERSVYLTAGLVTAESPKGRGRNLSVTIDPNGAEVSRYVKMQPFTPGGEADNFEAGPAVTTWAWHEFTVAPFVCYDLRFPEHFRAAARKGADLITVIANWPVARIHHWVALLQARAIENQAFVVGVNRCGTDPKLSYNGRSIIVSPKGDVLADAGNGECIISAALDRESLVAYRNDFPFLKDMK